MRIDTTETIRFWDWINGGFVKLSLSADGEINHYSGGPNEEGYSWHTLRYFVEDGNIICEYFSGGRDCDGPYRHGSRYIAEGYYCDDEGRQRLQLTEFDVWQRDIYAEQMGY